MSVSTRRTDPAPSHLAEARIKEAQEYNPKKVYRAVVDCCQMGRNFTGREIEKLMVKHYPGDHESGSICSMERVRGVLAAMKKRREVVPYELTGERGIYRYDPKWDRKDEPAPQPEEKKQQSMF